MQIQRHLHRIFSKIKHFGLGLPTYYFRLCPGEEARSVLQHALGVAALPQVGVGGAGQEQVGGSLQHSLLSARLTVGTLVFVFFVFTLHRRPRVDHIRVPEKFHSTL